MVKVRYRKGSGGDGPKISFAFFLAGALVVLVAVFVIGIQVGRVIEKEKIASPPGGTEEGTQVVKLTPPPAAAPGDAVLPGTSALTTPDGAPKEPPPLTFPDTLEKSEPVLVSLPKESAGKGADPLPATPAEVRKETGKGEGRTEASEKDKGGGGDGIFLQAGVFTDMYGAETVRKKIRRAGYPCTLRAATGKGGKALHKVLAGPFRDRSAARIAERKLKGAGVDVYLPRG